MKRPRVWRCGRFALDLSRPIVMGIVNVTPDSFSDGGLHFATDAAVLAGVRMLAEGADVIDVGGESTRPGASPVPVEEETVRVVPVVRALAARGACVSVDTRRPQVAAAALEAGASIVNDVSGLSDPEMVGVATGTDAGLVVMHMRGEPATMQSAPAYDDLLAEVAAFLGKQAAALEAAGVTRDRIAIDPGIGFGKTTAHNLELLRRLGELAEAGYPVMVGASRKRFIGEITGVGTPEERVAGSIAAAVCAVSHGASVVRVHDVAPTVQALAVSRAIEGEGPAR